MKDEEKYLQWLDDAVNGHDGDAEVSHMNADNVVALVLKDLGYEKLSDQYNNECKYFWYA